MNIVPKDETESPKYNALVASSIKTAEGRTWIAEAGGTDSISYRWTLLLLVSGDQREEIH